MKQEKVTSLTQEQAREVAEKIGSRFLVAGTGKFEPTIHGSTRYRSGVEEIAQIITRALASLQVPDKTDRRKLQQPDYRNNGKLQFVTGYTGNGAEMCVHLTREEYASRAEKAYGSGTLAEVDGIFYWDKTDRSSPTEGVNKVERLARAFATEYLTGHFRELREDERKSLDELFVVMLAFHAQAKRVESSEPEPVKHEKELGK